MDRIKYRSVQVEAVEFIWRKWNLGKVTKKN